jgi:hypothetical protein
MLHVNHPGIANIFEPLWVMMKNIVNKKKSMDTEPYCE